MASTTCLPLDYGSKKVIRDQIVEQGLQQRSGQGGQGVWRGSPLNWEVELLLATLSATEVVLNMSHAYIIRKEVKTYEEWKEESSSCLFHTHDQNFGKS